MNRRSAHRRIPPGEGCGGGAGSNPTSRQGGNEVPQVCYLHGTAPAFTHDSTGATRVPQGCYFYGTAPANASRGSTTSVLQGYCHGSTDADDERACRPLDLDRALHAATKHARPPGEAPSLDY